MKQKTKSFHKLMFFSGSFLACDTTDYLLPSLVNPPSIKLGGWGGGGGGGVNWGE